MAQVPGGSPRWLPFLLALIGIVTLIIALVHTPIGQWQGTGYLLGGAVLIISLLWLYLGIRGSYNLMGRMSARGAMILGVIGALASGFILGTTIITDSWTVGNVLMAGLWAQIGIMFVAVVTVASKMRKAAS